MGEKKIKSAGSLEKRRKLAEGTATFGSLLICVALIVPFTGIDSSALSGSCKWIFSAGSLIYLIARTIDVSDPGESMRIRRLRRIEFWAGIAFVMGAFFWFYQENHLGPYVGLLALMRNTIMFTLVGAFLQIIASWMIYYQSKKEQGSQK